MIKKICDSLRELMSLLKSRIEAKKNISRIKFQSISMAKTICWIQHTQKKQKIKAEKNSDKDRKALHKFMNNDVYGKAMENLRNRIDVKLVSNNNKKRQFKITSKPSYMPHKISDNELVPIRKNRVTLTLNKPVYIGMCILGLSKGLYIKYVGGGAGGFL